MNQNHPNAYQTPSIPAGGRTHIAMPLYPNKLVEWHGEGPFFEHNVNGVFVSFRPDEQYQGRKVMWINRTDVFHWLMAVPNNAFTIAEDLEKEEEVGRMAASIAEHAEPIMNRLGCTKSFHLAVRGIVEAVMNGDPLPEFEPDEPDEPEGEEGDVEGVDGSGDVNAEGSGESEQPALEDGAPKSPDEPDEPEGEGQGALIGEPPEQEGGEEKLNEGEDVGIAHEYTADELMAKTNKELVELAKQTPGVEVNPKDTKAELVAAFFA